MWHARDIVALIELIFYIPTGLLAIIVCFRHGFRRSSGWIYTLILCTIRIAGAICQFISHSNHSTGLIEAIVIFASIGLAPLLLATLGLLSRLVHFINDKSVPLLTAKYFRILQLLITVGLILSIVGGTSSTIQPDGKINVETTSKVGAILFIVAYAGIALMLVTSMPGLSVIPNRERRVAVVITLAMPFILVRLIYSACVVFVNNHLFNRITGSIATLVAMAVVEEFIVVAMYIALGFFIDCLERGSLDMPTEKVLGNRRGHTERRRHTTKGAAPLPVDTEGFHGGNLPQIGRY